MKQGWKKSELTLKCNGYYDLAAAVCRQWKIDGMPKGDATGVAVWADIMSMHRKQCGLDQRGIK